MHCFRQSTCIEIRSIRQPPASRPISSSWRRMYSALLTLARLRTTFDILMICNLILLHASQSSQYLEQCNLDTGVFRELKAFTAVWTLLARVKGRDRLRQRLVLFVWGVSAIEDSGHAVTLRGDRNFVHASLMCMSLFSLKVKNPYDCRVHFSGLNSDLCIMQLVHFTTRYDSCWSTVPSYVSFFREL